MHCCSCQYSNVGLQGYCALYSIVCIVEQTVLNVDCWVWTLTVTSFIYRVFSKGRNGVGASKSLIFGTFPDVLGFLWSFNMGNFSFWYFGDIWLKKKLKNLILQKSKISGLAQIGSILVGWILGVANFGFNYLWHFSINFEYSCAHRVANFLKFLKLPKQFKFACFMMFFKDVLDKILKN